MKTALFDFVAELYFLWLTARRIAVDTVLAICYWAALRLGGICGIPLVQMHGHGLTVGRTTGNVVATLSNVGVTLPEFVIVTPRTAPSYLRGLATGLARLPPVDCAEIGGPNALPSLVCESARAFTDVLMLWHYTSNVMVQDFRRLVPYSASPLYIRAQVQHGAASLAVVFQVDPYTSGGRWRVYHVDAAGKICQMCSSLYQPFGLGGLASCDYMLSRLIRPRTGCATLRDLLQIKPRRRPKAFAL